MGGSDQGGQPGGYGSDRGPGNRSSSGYSQGAGSMNVSGSAGYNSGIESNRSG